ncbi:hypothetical protein QBC45DRAFT_420000 [Copromyces sp. CBS 386.78]|nr:hypothetical protein QBC45DRAFT_420000 [Copromyces sp. CBS 386.78]
MQVCVPRGRERTTLWQHGSPRTITNLKAMDDIHAGKFVSLDKRNRQAVCCLSPITNPWTGVMLPDRTSEEPDGFGAGQPPKPQLIRAIMPCIHGVACHIPPSSARVPYHPPRLPVSGSDGHGPRISTTKTMAEWGVMIKKKSSRPPSTVHWHGNG